MLISGDNPKIPSASESNPSPFSSARNLKLMQLLFYDIQVLSWVSFPSNFADPYRTVFESAESYDVDFD